MEKSGHTPTILIVEDIDWIRLGMRKAVEREGFHVAEARNDAEAFGLIELQPIDLILTDEELPTFQDMMTRLREHPTLNTIPVAIVNPDAEGGARLGDAYLLADFADISSFLGVPHR